MYTRYGNGGILGHSTVRAYAGEVPPDTLDGRQDQTAD